MEEKTGIELIAEERQRQIEVEGWTEEHDAEHTNGSLAFAAVCYAIPNEYRNYSYCPLRKERVPDFWPWDKKWWKPCPEDRIRELVKAGALIAAEIDRLQIEKGAKKNEREIPNSAWKPTDEQMKALDIAIRCGIQLGTWEEKALKELREQLKKLPK